MQDDNMYIKKCIKLRDKREVIKEMRSDIREMQEEIKDIKHYKSSQDLELIYELIEEQMKLLDCNLMILKNLI
jgi:uncharacterized membrane protein (DUF106 family)